VSENVYRPGLGRVNGNSSPACRRPILGEKLIPNQGKIVWKKSGIFFPLKCGNPASGRPTMEYPGAGGPSSYPSKSEIFVVNWATGHAKFF
jgi:hypothetical protein